MAFEQALFDSSHPTCIYANAIMYFIELGINRILRHGFFLEEFSSAKRTI